MKGLLGSGVRFKKLSGNIAKEYKDKGMSDEKAEMIGRATAAKIGMAKYGKKKMLGLAKKGK